MTAGKCRALVTGASGEIGGAIAMALAALGYPVVLAYRRNHEAAEAVRSAIESAGGEASLTSFDVGDSAGADAALEAVLAADERPLGIVVNNAGIIRDAPFASLSPDGWSSVIRTTLDGFYNVTRRLVLPMIRRRWGRIINIASYSGVAGNPGQVHYSAAKAGLIGATKALSKELAQRNITVNAVAPGLIDSAMSKTIPIASVLPMIPSRRLGTAREVAGVVAFLTTDDAAYITGQVINVNGGLI